MMRFILQMSMLTMLFFQNTSFEVASIKPSAPDSRGSDVDRDGNLLRMRNVTLKRCITRAYGVSAAQVMGGPKWVDTQTYDIEAKADPSVTDDQVNTMLQSLLANRFALSLHKETRQLSGYAMTVGAKGIVAKPAATTSCDMDRSRGHIHASACSLQQLATKLSSVLEAPVVDATKLKGPFDFDLTWNPGDMGTNATIPEASQESSQGPSLFTAIQDELGLKLQGEKVSTDVLVIDRAQPPTGN
jgi:uncharacterized protein (TIGR03435 family)